MWSIIWTDWTGGFYFHPILSWPLLIVICIRFDGKLTKIGINSVCAFGHILQFCTRATAVPNWSKCVCVCVYNVQSEQSRRIFSKRLWNILPYQILYALIKIVGIPAKLYIHTYKFISFIRDENQNSYLHFINQHLKSECRCRMCICIIYLFTPSLPPHRALGYIWTAGMLFTHRRHHHHHHIKSLICSARWTFSLLIKSSFPFSIVSK